MWRHQILKSKVRATKGFILIKQKRYQIYTCLQLSSSIASFVWKLLQLWRNVRIAFVEKYTIIFFGSVQKVSWLDSQSNIVIYWPPCWRTKAVLQHGGSILGSVILCNILTNISTLGQRTNLKLGELSSLFVVHNITIFWLHSMHGFWFYLLLRDNAHTLLAWNLSLPVMSTLITKHSEKQRTSLKRRQKLMV